MNQKQAIEMLRAHADSFSTQEAAAKDLGIYRTHLNAMLGGKKKLSKRVLDKLRLRRVVTESYEPL